ITASAQISACLVDISSWMMAHQLKLSPSKTELLIIPVVQHLPTSCHIPQMSYRRATVAQIAEEVNAGSGRKVSEYTVHHSLLHMGLHSCRPVRVPMLTPVHHRKCQQWALEHQNWTTEQWKKVAWSVESGFLLHHVDVRVCVSLTWGTHGARMHYGKKVSRRRQCPALGNVLLGNLGSCHPCGCYFDT
ncbi:hypothetical protein QTP86_025787, partial [Hemibagrus guttatus]